MSTTTAQPRTTRTQDRRGPVLTLLAVAATLILWASAFVAIRHLRGDVPPGPLALARLLVGAIALGVMVARRPRRWPSSVRDWALVIACGVSWFGIYNVALNASEQHIDAGTSALVVQVGPIIVTLLATVLLGERLNRWVVLGLAIGFGGVVVIAEGASGHHGDLVGVLLAALAAVMYAVGVLTQKPLLSRLPGLEVTFLACAIGAVACLPWAGGLVHVVTHAPASDLWWMVYLGVLPTAVGFSLWAFALHHTDAGKLAMTTFLVPFLATGIGWILLSEVPPWTAFVGGALCIAGVLLTRRRPRGDGGSKREPWSAEA